MHKQLVVQSWVGGNAVLKFNTLFKFIYLHTTFYLKTSETKTTMGPDNISEEIIPTSYIDKLLGKFTLIVNLRLS